MAVKTEPGWELYSVRTTWDHGDIDRTQLTNAGRTARMRCEMGTFFVEVLPDLKHPLKRKKRCRQASGVAQNWK